MLKKAMMAAALALLFAGALAQKRQVMLDKVVAVVGGSSTLAVDSFLTAKRYCSLRSQ